MKKVEDFSDELKSVFHYPKENENRYERRTAGAMDSLGNVWACLSLEDNGKRLIEIEAADGHGKCVYRKIIRDLNMPSARVCAHTAAAEYPSFGSSIAAASGM
jgi:hypothetical protein